MKAYLLDVFSEYKRFSQGLDVKAIICNRPWYIFNEDGEKEVLIFQKDGSIIVSNNGIVSDGTWKYIPANTSLIITTSEASLMLHPIYTDNNIIAMNLDGSEEVLLLIDENKIQKLLTSKSEVNAYLEDNKDKLGKSVANDEVELDAITICIPIIVLIGLIITIYAVLN